MTAVMARAMAEDEMGGQTNGEHSRAQTLSATSSSNLVRHVRAHHLRLPCSPRLRPPVLPQQGAEPSRQRVQLRGQMEMQVVSAGCERHRGHLQRRRSSRCCWSCRRGVPASLVLLPLGSPQPLFAVRTAETLHPEREMLAEHASSSLSVVV